MPYRHIFCHGHGAYEAEDLKAIAIPSDAKVVIYAPPGAAMADDYAEDVQALSGNEDSVRRG
jgi:hypothetical protein